VSSGFILLRQRRVAAGNGLGNILGTTIKYLRRTTSGAAGNGQGATAKCLWQTTVTGSSLTTTIKFL
jgi:hypothetical protein